jgi:predicted transposase/invertase (TIGR01784 family)
VRARQETADESLQANLVELIETVIVYKLPRLSREEIQAMLQVNDLRETKVYQEAKQEGWQEGRQEGRQEGIVEERRRAIARLAARDLPVQQIADLLGLAIDEVRSELPGPQP